MPESKTNDDLELLDTLIIRNLSRNEPQTKRKTARAISKDYKSTWNSFKRLQEKNLVKQAGILPYNNSDYPTYWLTDEGIIRALLDGANPNVLLLLTRTLYPNNKTVHCFLAIISLFDLSVVEIAYSSVKRRGKLGIRELMMLFLAQPEVAMNDETATKLGSILMEYAHEQDMLKKGLEEMIESLSKLNQLIKQSHA